MAWSQGLETRTYLAAADLSAKQYFIVNANSSDRINIAGAGGQAVGVLQDDPAAAGRAACVAVSGVSKVVAGGTCTAGSFAASDSAGKAVNAASGDIAIGKFRSGTSTAGDIVSMEVMPQLGKIW